MPILVVGRKVWVDFEASLFEGAVEVIRLVAFCSDHLGTGGHDVPVDGAMSENVDLFNGVFAEWKSTVVLKHDDAFAFDFDGELVTHAGR